MLLAMTFTLTGLVPDRGRPGLYLSLFHNHGTAAVAFAAAHRATVLRRGPTNGSLVLLAPSRSLFVDALAEGALFLAVPASWCGAEQTSWPAYPNKSASRG